MCYIYKLEREEREKKGDLCHTIFRESGVDNEIRLRGQRRVRRDEVQRRALGLAFAEHVVSRALRVYAESRRKRLLRSTVVAVAVIVGRALGRAARYVCRGRAAPGIGLVAVVGLGARPRRLGVGWGRIPEEGVRCHYPRLSRRRIVAKHCACAG